MKQFIVDRKKTAAYALICTAVTLLLLLSFAIEIFHISQKAPELKVQENNIAASIFAPSNQQDIGMKVFMMVFTIAIYALFINNILVAHRKLDIDQEFITIYPSFNEMKISWKSIHAVHVGYMHDQGMRLPFFRMKILYTLDGKKLKHTSIPIKRFEKYDNLIEAVQNSCEQLKIDFFKV